MLVAEPLAGGVEFFEGVLEVVAVVRVEVVGAVFFQREQSRGGIERGDELDEIPPAVLGEDVEFEVLGFHIECAFSQMALGSSGRREGWHKGPATVERVLRVEVRVTSEDLAFAVAEQLFRQESFREELRDIGFDDFSAVFFPAADVRAADEGALRAGDREIGILRFERERREQFGGAFWEVDRGWRGVTGLAGLADLLESLVRSECR